MYEWTLLAYSGAVPTVATYLGLLVIAVMAFALRVRWPRLTRQARRRWMLAGFVLVLPTIVTLLTKWDVQSLRLRDVEQWIRIGAVEVLLIFFTLLRPRALSIFVVAVLLPFLFSTAVAGPLTNLFRNPVVRTLPIMGGYVLQTISWQSDGGSNSGVDYDLSYRPPHLPGMRRGIVGTRFYSTQCDTGAVFATLKPSDHTLDVYCPPFELTNARAVVSGTHDHYVVPKGAMSEELQRLAHR